METPSTAETSNDLSSDAQTVAHSATSINSTCTSSRATGTAAVNDTNGKHVIRLIKLDNFFTASSSLRASSLSPNPLILRKNSLFYL